MARNRWLFIVFTLGIMVLSGCAGVSASNTSPTPAPPSSPTLGSKQLNDLTITLSSSPTPPIRGVGMLEAAIVDAKGQPVTDAQVSFDLDMTTMSHGKNVVPATQTTQGRYTGQVRFVMPGPWRTLVLIERPGQPPMQVRFDFPVNLR